MMYVGLDLHSKQSTFCLLDENGKKLKTHTIHGSVTKVLEVLKTFKKPFAICYEASTGYGYFYDRVCRVAATVVVAHPGQLRLIFRAKRKTDRIDAQKLAKLLFLDEVPSVYVPGVDTRAWRSMIEHRHTLVAERTRYKNRIRALLRSHGMVAPKGLWTLGGIDWLKSQIFPTDFDGVQRDILAERLREVDIMIGKVTKLLDARGRADAGVQLLMTIPGVGARTAEAVVAYIDDPRRFPKNKAIGSYFGLVPCEDTSVKQRLGRITRQGPATVRKLLTEAAWQGIRRSKQIRNFFERIVQDNPERRKKAVTATAHYMLRAMLSMLQTGELWRHAA
ncbi:MAG: IS110 family transposase [Phycisphaerae bacterium]